nr:putative glucose-6-phosphate 1-epimerase [Tanacetum cinerariifolium]
HGGSKQIGLKQLGSKQVGFKQLGVKQVGFKQLGPGVETGVHGVQDEKRVWFEVELQGVQGDREAEFFRIDNGKSVQMPLGGRFKLSLKDYPIRDCDVERMMKWVLKYLRGTVNVGLIYGTNYGNHKDVTGFVDSDYAKDPDKEAEYMALTEAVKEAIWLRELLEELEICHILTNLKNIIMDPSAGLRMFGSDTIKLDWMDGMNFTHWEQRKRDLDETLCRGYILSTLTDRLKNLVSGFKLCKSRVKAVIESDKVIMSKANVFVGKTYACDGSDKGGQVISWRKDRGDEHLFTSSKVVKAPKVNRGGIAICFPQFSNCGSLEQQGFVRNKLWIVDEAPPPLPAKSSNGSSFIDLLLKPSEEDLKQLWNGLKRFVHFFLKNKKMGHPALVSDSKMAIEWVKDSKGIDQIVLRNPRGASAKVSLQGGQVILWRNHRGDEHLFTSSKANRYANLVLELGHDALMCTTLDDFQVVKAPKVNRGVVANSITLKPGQEWTGRLDITVAPSSFSARVSVFEVEMP